MREKTRKNHSTLQQTLHWCGRIRSAELDVTCQAGGDRMSVMATWLVKEEKCTESVHTAWYTNMQSTYTPIARQLGPLPAFLFTKEISYYLLVGAFVLSV